MPTDNELVWGGSFMSSSVLIDKQIIGWSVAITVYKYW